MFSPKLDLRNFYFGVIWNSVTLNAYFCFVFSCSQSVFFAKDGQKFSVRSQTDPSAGGLERDVPILIPLRRILRI